jgi:hypothetical protein
MKTQRTANSSLCRKVGWDDSSSFDWASRVKLTVYRVSLGNAGFAGQSWFAPLATDGKRFDWITGTEKPPAERIPVAAPDFKLHKQRN